MLSENAVKLVSGARCPSSFRCNVGLGYLQGYNPSDFQSHAHSSFDADMASLGIKDIVPELLEELERKRQGRKQVFSTEAIKKVVVL